jgi:hypothetical protein
VSDASSNSSGARRGAIGGRPRWTAVLPAVVAVVALVAAMAVALRSGDDPAPQDADEAAGLSSPDPDAPPVAITSSAPRYGSLQHLVAASGLIVEAEVVATVPGRWFGEPSAAGGSGRILSRLITLRVDRVLSGPSPEGGEVLVEEEGWSEDGAPLVIDGLGAAELGDQGFWFLVAGGDPDTGAYLVVNFQGRYLLRGGRLEGATPDPSAGEEAYGFDLVAQIEAMSPADLVTAVAASAVSSSSGAHPLDEPAPAATDPSEGSGPAG